VLIIDPAACSTTICLLSTVRDQLLGGAARAVGGGQH
jgi:hypothetical protein